MKIICIICMENVARFLCQIYLIICTVLMSSQLRIFSNRIERVGLENLSFLAKVFCIMVGVLDGRRLYNAVPAYYIPVW